MAQDDIQGQVVDASGTPVDGAIVELTKSYQSSPVEEQVVRRTTTDSNGNYLFEKHPDGDGTTQEWHVSAYNHDGTAYVNSFSNPGVTADLPESLIPDSAVANYDPTTETSTGDITAIADQIGSLDLSGNAAVISSGINSKQTYRFDGSEIMDNDNTAASTESYAVIATAQIQETPNASNNRYIFGGGNDVNNFNINDDNSLDWSIFRGGSFLGDSNADNPPDNNVHIFELVADNTDQVEMLIDGATELGPGTAASANLTGFALGARGDGFGNTEIDYGDVTILENTSAADRQTERQRQADKWGVTL